MKEQQRQTSPHSEEVDDLLAHQPHWIQRWGILGAGSSLLALMVLCYFFKYPQTLSATMTLTGSNPPVFVVAKASGEVGQIFVKDGQLVSRGATLAVLRSAASYQDVMQLQAFLDTIKATLHCQTTCPTGNRSLQLGDMQSSYSDLLVKLDSYNLFLRNNYYALQLDAKHKEMAANGRRTATSRRQLGKVRTQHSLQLNAYQRNKVLYDKGLISLQELEDARNQLLESELSVETASTSMDDNGAERLQLESDMAEIRQQYAEKMGSLTSELAAMIGQLAAEAASWRLAYVLVSPTEGKVAFTRFWANSQNVAVGDSVFSVIPRATSTLQGRLSLPSTGAGRVRRGQRVHVFFDNFPKNEYGIVKGRVEKIAPLPDKNGNYTVEVSFPQGLRTTYKKMLPQASLMSGTASIVTEDTSLLEQLFLPLKNLFKNR